MTYIVYVFQLPKIFTENVDNFSGFLLFSHESIHTDFSSDPSLVFCNNHPQWVKPDPSKAKKKKKHHRGFLVFSCFPCSHMLSFFSFSPFTVGWMLFYHLLTSQSPQIKYSNSACSSCHCFSLNFFFFFLSPAWYQLYSNFPSIFHHLRSCISYCYVKITH